jgi:hypothetical protein
MHSSHANKKQVKACGSGCLSSTRSTYATHRHRHRHTCTYTYTDTDTDTDTDRHLINIAEGLFILIDRGPILACIVCVRERKRESESERKRERARESERKQGRGRRY